MTSSARIALVLGGGGITGHAFHAGLLWAIAEATEWDPRDADVIVGTSAGSIVAAMLRGGFPARDLAARLLGNPLSPEGQALAARMGPPIRDARMDRRRMLIGGIASPELLLRSWMAPWRARIGTLAAAALPEGRIPSEPLVAGIRRLHPAWPERATWLCAVALNRGNRVVFGKDGAPETTVADAVRASCAIPSFYEPAIIDGKRYVDGGAHSPTNADVLADGKIDFAIVSSPMSTLGGARTLDTPSRVYFRWKLGQEATRLRRAGAEVLTFQPTPEIQKAMGINALDSRKRDAVVRSTRDAVLRRLERDDFKDRLAALKA